MTDPLSISASIAGLIGLAELIVGKGYCFAKTAAGAEKEIASLIAEVTTLYGVLSSVNLVTIRLEQEGVDKHTRRPYEIHAIQTTLKKVEDVVEKCSNSSTSGNITSISDLNKLLRWPSIIATIQQLISDIEKHKSTLNLALAADGLSTLIQSLDKQNEIRDSIKELEMDARRRKIEDLERRLEEKRSKVLDNLAQVDPKSIHGAVQQLRQEGTGLWFLESHEYLDWLKSKNGRLWLYGIPGAGKTVLMSLIIDTTTELEDEKTCLAYFYCTYKDPKTQDCMNILGALIRQMALQNEQAFHILDSYVERYQNSKTHTPNEEELQEIFGKLARCFETTMIIIDGLDECQSDRQKIVEVLAGLVDTKTDSSVKTLYASRKEVDIENILSDYTKVSIAARSSDLRLYVSSEIAARRKGKSLFKDPELYGHIMEKLIEKSEGMYVKFC